jgi:hypothetical protein
VKAQLSGPERKSKASIAISIAAHVVLVLGLAAITFRPLREILLGPAPAPLREQTVRYVRVAPEPPRVVGRTGARSASEARATAAARTVLAPRNIPVGIPTPAAPTAATRVVVGANNQAGRAQRMAAGVEPGIPDPRIAMNPMAVGYLPKTDAQKADSALSAIYDMYVDSVKAALAAPRGRAPGDWSWGGKDGDKWGWDQAGIRLGGITIPNAVLAALPLNIGPQGRNMNALIEGRTDAYMRADIQMHANIMSEDEFRVAVNRIHARIDRERQEKMARARKPPQ